MTRSSLWWTALLIVTPGILLAGGAWSCRTEERSLPHENEKQLPSIAELKAGQITVWRIKRSPWTRGDAPAVIAARGREGIVQGIDDGGVEVLSGARFQSPLVLAVVLLCLVVATVAVLSAWQRRARDHWRALFTAGAGRRCAEERYRGALLNIGERYRSLFNQMTEGFALHEIICDERGEPCDYRFLDVNPAFEQLTGLKRDDVVGRTMREVLPAEKHDWIRTYGAVALTGAPTRFEDRAVSLGRHFEVLAYCPAPRSFAVLFTDITERKRIEVEIGRVNRLYAALSALNQVVVDVDSREELFREVCRIATERAGFKLAWIGWVDDDTRRVVPVAWGGEKQDYLDEIEVCADDTPAGRGPTGTCIREDRVDVVPDFLSDPRTAPWHEAAAKREFRTAAALPIRFRGKVVGALTAYDNDPNVIQEREIALIDEAAAVISLALERLDQESLRKRAEEALDSNQANPARIFWAAGQKTRKPPAFCGVSSVDINQCHPNARRFSSEPQDTPEDRATQAAGRTSLGQE